MVNARMLAAVLGASCAVSAQGSAQGDAQGDAVEWRVTDGGNGHWYQLTAAISRWPDSAASAVSLGGMLCSITTEAENSFIVSLIGDQTCWIGGRRNPANFSEFVWLDGSTWKHTHFQIGEPNGCNPCGEALYLAMNAVGWDDTGLASNDPGFRGIVEWEGDCNNNSIIDYGEIRAGLAIDTNANNIPDTCECAENPALPICCPGDVVASGEVNAVDLAAVLSAWGTDGGKFRRADVDGSGLVDAADLTVVLSSWGSCL